jgi:RNA polymerase sigma factor (sigma-70 family)
MPSPHASGSPPALERLLCAQGPDRDAAWAEFLAQHSGLLLHTCRMVEHDRDAAMDGYAHVLEALRENDFRRLRGYVPDGRTRFSTWLVVVVRRLLLDHYRHRYGRPRSERESRRADHLVRRRLEDLVAAEVDPDELEAASAGRPDTAVRRAELADALRSALAELPPADRLLLALRFEDERPVKEIASMLALPTVFHVYRRLAAVLAVLKAALARRGVETPEP